MEGTHLEFKILTKDIDSIENDEGLISLLEQSAAIALSKNDTVLERNVYSFKPSGKTGYAISNRALVNLHTWPEHLLLLLDYFGFEKAEPEELARQVAGTVYCSIPSKNISEFQYTGFSEQLNFPAFQNDFLRHYEFLFPKPKILNEDIAAGLLTRLAREAGMYVLDRKFFKLNSDKIQLALCALITDSSHLAFIDAMDSCLIDYLSCSNQAPNPDEISKLIKKLFKVDCSYRVPQLPRKELG